MNNPKSKEVKIALVQIECPITHKIISRYIKGLEEMLAENAEKINSYESLLKELDNEHL